MKNHKMTPQFKEKSRIHSVSTVSGHKVATVDAIGATVDAIVGPL